MIGRYPGEPMHIELETGTQPVYCWPYPVPMVHMATFKKELDHLVEIGVLSPVRDTKWGLPTFITPKKDGRVQWVSDMRELNKVIKRTQCNLPIITDVLRKQKKVWVFDQIVHIHAVLHLWNGQRDQEAL